MTDENDLIQKLMISKKIMEKHNETPRSGISAMTNYSSPEVETFETPKAKYNLPQELLQETSAPIRTNSQPMSEDRIMASKLPDEIKRLMIENPINQPSSVPSLSNELIDKAARLMGTDARGNQSVPTTSKSMEQTKQPQLDYTQLRNMLKEVVEEVLTDKGIITESSEKTNEMFTFKVGKHIFTGKINKVQKTR